MAASALALTLAAPPAARAQVVDQVRSRGEDVLRYRLQAGDSLYALAGRYLRRQQDYRTLQNWNRVGRPRGMSTGAIIAIPTRLLKAEDLTARILAFRGEVTVAQPGGSGTARTGMSIVPGARIATQTGSFVTLELSNGSRMTMPSLSVLRVVAMRRFLLGGRLDLDFVVEKGRVETSATPLGNTPGSYRIRTPIAVSAVRGTTFRVGYEGADAPSLTEVLEGTVAVAPGGGQATDIPTGYGAGVSSDGNLAREELLPPPLPMNPGKVQVDPVVALSAAPVEGATAYRFQIAKDAGFVDIIAQSVSATPTAMFDDIADGRWFVRVTAIARSGLEGMPGVYAMRRALTGLSATAEGGEDGWTFRWSGSGEGKRIYRFQLRPVRPGALPLIDETGLTGGVIRLSDLPPGNYVWRVGVRQFGPEGMTENWLPESGLLVAAPE